MHYYQFNISDWALHTSHLTLEEEGVYRRILDHYYDSEKPIPKITQPVIRRLRLVTHSDTFGLILSEFFLLEADGWHNHRADIEIKEYHHKAEVARLNGKKGGRPKKKAPVITEPDNPVITQPVNLANPDITQSEPSAKLTKNYELQTTNQELGTINQQQVTIGKSKDLSAEADARMFEQFWSAGMRKVSKQSAVKAFNKVIKSQPDKQSFTDQLVFDIQERLRVGQMGFAEMHPTTYLNGQRWEDEAPAAPVSHQQQQHNSRQAELAELDNQQRQSQERDISPDQHGLYLEHGR